MIDKIKNNKYIVLLLIIGAVYFFLRFLFPILAPVVVAVLFLTMFYPFLDDMHKKTRIKKQFLAATFIVFIGIVVAVVLWIFIMIIMQYIPYWFEGLDDLQTQVNLFIQDCGGLIEQWFDVDATSVEGVIIEKVNIFVDDFQLQVLPELLNYSWGYAKSILSLGGFIAITVITTVLLAKDYDEILDKVAVNKDSRMAMEIIVRVIKYIATFMKAQLIIMGIIGTLAMLVLSLTGIPQGALWGALAGILDMLPFIGTGVVLVPLAIWQLLQGMYGKALVCLGLYGASMLIRELLEPRLIGAKVGIYPVGVLVAVYGGVKLFGIGGIFLGPIAMVMIQQIYRVYLRYVDETSQKDYDESI